MTRAMTLVLAMSFIAEPAFAFHCPQDMAKIDAAMKTAQLSPADKATVEKYRKEGEELHKAGKHQESVTLLDKALAILKLGH